MQATHMGEPHKRLQQARELAGYETKADAANALGVPLGTYYGHENGSRGFDDDAARYAAFYRVNFEWLMTGKGEPRPKSLDAVVSALPPADQAEIRRYIEYIQARAAQKRTG